MTQEQSTNLPDGFVDLTSLNTSIITDIRYSTEYNFVGRKIAGYKANKIIISEKVAKLLLKVQEDVAKDGFNIIVYEAYRPMLATDDFLTWCENFSDIKMKQIFYPELDKNFLFEQGFISKKSAHSRGSAIDVSLIKKDDKISLPILKYKIIKDKEIPCYDDNSIDMGTHFDYFGDESFTSCPDISPEARKNRNYLVSIMKKYGFINYEKEWWHFNLPKAEEPFPDTFFAFPII